MILAINCQVGVHNGTKDKNIQKDYNPEISQDFDRVALQFWSLLNDNRIDEIESRVNGFIDKERLEKLRGELSQPINYDWKIVKGVSNNFSTNYSYFVSLPQYINDPERVPFIQILCKLDSSQDSIKASKISLLFNGEVNQKEFNRSGINPSSLSLKELYEIKYRTVHTVLDSLNQGEIEDDFISTISRILQNLENDEVIQASDSMVMSNYTYSENSFYSIGILLPFFNENIKLDASRYRDQRLEDANYLLRDELLKELDFVLSNYKSRQEVNNYVYVNDECLIDPTEEFSPKIAEDIRHLITQAQITAGVERFMRVKLPLQVINRLVLYCSVSRWIGGRFQLVKRGEESSSKLLTMNSIMVSSMLNYLSDLEK